MFFQNIEIIKTPVSREKVIFQCDEIYFNNYAYFNLMSCNNVGHDVHIHLINPSQEFLSKLDKLKLSIDLSISTEHLKTDNVNFYKLKSYYFCSRYFIADLLFSKNFVDKLFITDADIVFNESISFLNDIHLGVLYYPQHTNLWKQTGANFLCVSKERKDFVKKIIDIYLDRIANTDFEKINNDMDKFERANLYALDQVCMSLIMQNENVEDKHFLNLAGLEKFISKHDNAKIWSFTGNANKKNNNLKTILEEKFNSVF